ncbi:MAG: TonB-dependent receptor [Bacteroidales bacterium]|nr:TonB-dependent receptor [Bacteroidales bacterium]
MKKSLLTLVMTVVASVMAMAQVTTSALSGIVTDAEGEVLGATVQAVHVPSGTHYGAITNEKGAFAIRGMRVGGPYEVTISYVGATTRKFEDITLQLGETFNLNVELAENADVLGEVVVVGQGTKFHSLKTGAATNISNSQMTALPTVSRSITDMTRLSPYGGNGMTFAGTDGRTANFTVDGANFNNNFGLSSALPGGGNPISIDAIEEMQVVISPFDVRQTGFIGGAINAITKSGTNTFKGTAYVHHRNENLRGDVVYNQHLETLREKDRQTTWGFTVGGPIIKNKLFFFANAEWQKTPTIANRWHASEDGVANPDSYTSRTTIADLQKVSDHVKQKYGYDTGSFTSFPADEDNKKLLFRIDWNITDNHHLAVRYNHTLNNNWQAPNGTSMDGGTRMSGYRTSQYSMSYANAMYAIQNKVNSFSVDLNSRFTDKLSNQFLMTFSKLDDVRDTNSSEFPFIDILKDDQNYIALGYELFTWNNGVHNNIFNVKDEVTYYYGKHKILGGMNYEYQMADNMYMRNGTGYYRYKSLDDFLNGATPEVVCLTYGYDGEDKPAARVTFHKAGIYGQDEWDLNERLKLNLGIRFDALFFDENDLMTNKKIYDLDYNGRHIDTGKWPKTQVGVSPRIGASWDVLGTKQLIVRGGTGLFQGRLPLVFFTNMPTNSGMVQYQAQLGPSAKYANLPDEVQAKFGSMADVMAQFAGGLVHEGNSYVTPLKNKLISMGFPQTITPEKGAKPSSISAVDPDFKMPMVWKTSVAVDYAFNTDFPLSVTAETIFNKTVRAASISDWSIPSVGGFARFNGVDNRPIYPAGYRTGTKAFMLENTHKGYGSQTSFTIKSSPLDYLDLMFAYTHSVTKELTSMPGSAAESAFTYVPTVEGPNNIKLHNSLNNTPDRMIASVNVNKGGNHFSLIYEAFRGGYNYSYMLTNDMNGDGYAYDALYIPTDEEVRNGSFRFASEDDRDRFMAFVHHDDYLSDHQGEYAEPYSLINPWVHRFDISYKRDFKFQIAETTHKFQLGFDIRNVGNLLNDKWGVMRCFNSAIGSEARILKYDGVDKDGYAVFSTPKAVNGDAPTFIPNKAAGQNWYMSISAKYFFN